MVVTAQTFPFSIVVNRRHQTIKNKENPGTVTISHYDLFLCRTAYFHRVKDFTNMAEIHPCKPYMHFSFRDKTMQVEWL